MSDRRLLAVLDSLLEYVDDYLPPPLRSFVTSFLSHLLTLLTAFISLVSSFLASKPWEWDAQSIIPPLISLLAAYLALVSLYRTTTWVFRTAFWFVKWGMILAILAGGVGWYMGDHGVNGGDLVSSLSEVLDALNGGGREDTGARFSQATPRTSSRRMKPWESFKDQWQHREDSSTEAQQIMSDIAEAANRVLTEGGWWNAARSILTSNDARSGEEDRAARRNRDQSSRK